MVEALDRGLLRELPVHVCADPCELVRGHPEERPRLEASDGDDAVLIAPERRLPGRREDLGDAAAAYLDRGARAGAGDAMVVAEVDPERARRNVAGALDRGELRVHLLRRRNVDERCHRLPEGRHAAGAADELEDVGGEGREVGDRSLDHRPDHFVEILPFHLDAEVLRRVVAGELEFL